VNLKKVETMAELEKFNNYFHNYILDLVYGLSEIYIRRMRYIIDYFRDDKQFEASCRIGAINLEKFEKDLAEAKAFIPGPSDFGPPEDNPAPSSRGSKASSSFLVFLIKSWLSAPSGRGSEASSSPQNDTIELKLSEAATQNRGGPTPGWQWILWILISVYSLICLIILLS
jgi:hypothetical protein